ncbi:MAG: sodium bile acid symporter family-domain-containing protein [Monoraphidium minutum]|nr:MAG: sodium bile acid symporter family-domain-containing protein [Monoraphidium minutum]
MPDEDAAVVECGACDRACATGLRCRFANGGADAPAWRDPESGCIHCHAPKDCAQADLRCEVLDASGRVLYRGPAAGAKAPGAGAGADHADAPAAAAAAAPPPPRLPWLDRLLPLWIAGAMVGGVLLGVFVPGVGAALGVADVAGVSLPIALGLWLMMWPVLTKVRYELLGRLLDSRAALRQLAASAALNWLLGPALMTGLAWAALPDLPELRRGVIMVGLARCIAMVLIWNQLALGDAEMCAVMVAFNSVLQIALYAPLAIFYLQVVSGGAAVHIGFWPVAKSVLMFLGVPLVAGVVLRFTLIAAAGRPWFEKSFMPWFEPCALIGLLYTIVAMFASQGKAIISQLGSVARVSVPMLAYFLLMFALSLAVAWAARMPYAYAATQAFTAASNNFELAIAVAVGTFGLQSAEALAATVGPLIEVPVLLALVHAALWAKARWWDARDAALAAAEGAARRGGGGGGDKKGERQAAAAIRGGGAPEPGAGATALPRDKGARAGARAGGDQ